MRKIYFILIFSLVTLIGKGQSRVLFQERNAKSQSFRYGAGTNANAGANRILKLITDAEGRPSGSVEFAIDFMQNLRVARDNPKQISIQVDHNGLRISRDVTVRGFSVANFLFPSAVSFSFTLQSRDIRQPYTFSTTRKINDGVVERADARVNDSLASEVTLSVSELNFSFDEQSYRRMSDHIDRIKKYYASDVLIQQNYDLLMRLNPRDPISLDQQNAALMNIEQFIASTNAQDFPSHLDLNQYDPIGFKGKFDQLSREAAARRVAMNETKATLYLFFYNAGLDLKARRRDQDAYDAFHRSLLENPLFAPASYQIALMDYQSDRLEEAECRFRSILDDMPADPDIARMSSESLGAIYSDYIAIAEDLTTRNHFDDALDRLQKARNLCRGGYGLRCDDQLEAALERAHKGKYQSLLDQAKVSYEKKDLDLAERQISKALDYQRRNNRYIPSAQSGNDMLRAVRQSRYNLMIADANNLVKQQSYAQALEKVERAAAYSEEFQLVPDGDFTFLRQSAAKPVILREVSEGKRFAQQNNLRSARSKAVRAERLRDENQLSTDQEVVNAIREFRELIFSQECLNAQRQLDSLASEAGRSYDKQDYLAADRLIRSALKISDDNRDCNLSEGNLRVSLDSMRSAVAYQTLVKDALWLQSNNRQADAYSKYMEAGNLFSRESVRRFGLQHEHVDTFAIQRGSNEFMAYLGGLYLDQKEPDHSLAVFRRLLSRGVDPSLVRDDLMRLGTELAIRDKRGGRATDWKSGALTYTAGDKRLKYLEKGYKQGWKRA